MNFFFPGKLLFALLASSVGSIDARITATPSSVCKITSYRWVHKVNDQVNDAEVVSAGDAYIGNVDDCEINIIAITEENCGNKLPIRCVKIQLGKEKREERDAPYTLFGDTLNTPGGEYFFGTPDLGEQTLQAWAYTDSGCSMGETPGPEVKLSLIGGDLSPRFRVYDVSTDIEIGSIVAGNNKNSVCLPNIDASKVNIEAVAADSCVKNIKMNLTSADKNDERTANTVPFYLFGDNEGINGGKDDFLLNTDYTITATPNGDTSKTLSSKFQFLECTDPDVVVA